MELIIKPTGKCNFACDFCMSGKVGTNIKHFEHVPDELKKTINVLKPELLIFNGGDPLLSGPQYFREILEFCDSNVAFVTNLKDFYLNPDKWVDIFRNPRVSVTTSFQYGSGRRWSQSEVYKEEKFVEICQLFYKLCNFMPMFIAVIDEENEDRALDHVYLAKRLGTQCRLNPVLPIGLASKAYPKYKMIDIWLKIQELGLEEYANPYSQFYHGGCSFNTGLMCQKTIRVFWIDNNDKIHYSSCDNCSTLGDQIPLEDVAPKCEPTPIDLTKLISGTKCLSCQLCRFCNACVANREANRHDPNYCSEMKKRIPKLLASGWKL